MSAPGPAAADPCGLPAYPRHEICLNRVPPREGWARKSHQQQVFGAVVQLARWVWGAPNPVSSQLVRFFKRMKRQFKAS